MLNSSVPSQKRFPELQTVIAAVPKLLALASFVCVALSAVYNIGYFSVIDINLVAILDIQDYVQSGIAFLPFTVGITALNFGVAYWLGGILGTRSASKSISNNISPRSLEELEGEIEKRTIELIKIARKVIYVLLSISVLLSLISFLFVSASYWFSLSVVISIFLLLAAVPSTTDVTNSKEPAITKARKVVKRANLAVVVLMGTMLVSGTGLKAHDLAWKGLTQRGTTTVISRGDNIYHGNILRITNNFIVMKEDSLDNVDVLVITRSDIASINYGKGFEVQPSFGCKLWGLCLLDATAARNK